MVEQCRRNRLEAVILESSPGPQKVARSAARQATLARLNGSQTAAEILNIFRETPEFGRSLAMRIEPFLDESSAGELILIGGGGEAAVFGDPTNQSVVKLFAPPCKARFGWIMECDSARHWAIRPGNLAEAI